MSGVTGLVGVQAILAPDQVYKQFVASDMALYNANSALVQRVFGSLILSYSGLLCVLARNNMDLAQHHALQWSAVHCFLVIAFQYMARGSFAAIPPLVSAINGLAGAGCLYFAYSKPTSGEH